MAPALPPWRIWIDTGGTFTDCIALDREDSLHRCKVLSSGTLRNRMVAVNGSNTVALDGADDLPPGFFDGWTVTPLGGGPAATIGRQDRDTGEIKFESGNPAGLGVGSAVELRTGEEAPLLAARLVTGTRLADPLPPISMRLATTRGTNALLERRGARTVLFVTEGFEDLLFIGDQTRPDLFALDIVRARPLPERVIGVRERLAADGEVLSDLDESSLRGILRDLRQDGFECAAVALLHGHRNPVHEERLEGLLRDAGFSTVSRSSRISPFQGLLRRAQTCVVDAYLGPVIADYLQAVKEGLVGENAGLHVMTSAGGLVGGADFRPKDSLLSGPAGGVVGAALAGRRHGHDKIIAFDMGGTSTDVSRFDGDFSYVFDHRVGSVELAAPALAIETVAAGGGSICHAALGRPAVGPRSAGAQPGPACYGAGGPLSITDVNVLLGRLLPERFSIPIDVAAAAERLEELRRDLAAPGGEMPAAEDLLEGLLQIADERMAEAIRGISVREGVDPAGYALVAFGGAGGQHACRVADLLGMRTILVPADAGLLSAMGLGCAAVERFAEREILEELDAVEGRVEDLLAELEAEADEALLREGVDRRDIGRPRRIAELRYLGQDASIEVEPRPGADLASEFERRYEELFAHRAAGRRIELVSLRVVARSRQEDPAARVSPASSRPGAPAASQRCFLDGEWREVPCHEVEDLSEAQDVAGPALLQQRHSALVVAPHWRAEKLDDGGVLLTRETAESVSRTTGGRRARPAAVELELMKHRFESIATEMGEMLKRTAISTNIKERQDFSCTLLDPDGRLVVNAPHIPVHLGAMGLCVRTLADRVDLSEGDVVVTNHPAFGGSHLPDVTLVAPVHFQGRLLGFVACRAHHAEIGGVQPGSMPPNARSLAEEAVVIPPTKVMEAGVGRWERIEALLTGGEFPTRSPADNLADLRAMMAAIVRGRDALVRLADQVGPDHVGRHMEALREVAARQVGDALEKLADGVYSGRQELDDGSALAAALTVAGRRARLDFGGSAGVHPGNLNATPAIVQSVTMYVMRLLVDAELPLNDGLLDPLEIVIPTGILNPDFSDDPARCPAIVGGNVETSQRLTDTLIEALGLAGCSQGTMNNFSFGSDAFGYYETVGGGGGATLQEDGADGVHTHMTNTKITDPEIIEHRYPVRLHRFAVREGSGGRGKHRGGEGLIREVEFLEELELAFLGQHRRQGPFGLDGGLEGAVGRQCIIRADGRREPLEGVDGCTVQPGDRFILETPGGGGCGEPGKD